MIQLFNVNPFAEAMLYYLGKANNNNVKKRFEKVIRKYPEHKKELEKAAKPAKVLEKLLDTSLAVDEALVDKFFRNIDGLDPYLSFGICVASVMVFFPLTDHPEFSTQELAKYLRECSVKERMYSLCFGLIDKNGTLDENESSEEEFSKRVESLQISDKDKLKLLNAAFIYGKHIDELLSLILPAAEIIETAHSEYDEIIREFYARYSGGDAQALIESCFVDKWEPVDITKVIPLIFGFDGRTGIINTRFPAAKSDNGNSIKQTDDIKESPVFFGRMFLGVGRHIIGSTEKNEVPALCEKIKALSDVTRLEMLFYLCSHKAYGQELCAKFDMVQSVGSYHIAKLLAAGFVTAEVSGGKTYYTADKAGIQKMLDAFAEKIK